MPSWCRRLVANPLKPIVATLLLLCHAVFAEPLSFSSISVLKASEKNTTNFNNVTGYTLFYPNHASNEAIIVAGHDAFEVSWTSNRSSEKPVPRMTMMCWNRNVTTSPIYASLKPDLTQNLNNTVAEPPIILNLTAYSPFYSPCHLYLGNQVSDPFIIDNSTKALKKAPQTWSAQHRARTQTDMVGAGGPYDGKGGDATSNSESLRGDLGNTLFGVIVTVVVAAAGCW